MCFWHTGPSLLHLMLLLALGWLAVATIASSPPIWSQLGHDAQHTGRSAVQGPLTQPSQRWQVLFNDLARQYFAVDRDGVVIVARDDTVTALDPATGGVNWQYSLGADDDGFGVQFSSTVCGLIPRLWLLSSLQPSSSLCTPMPSRCTPACPSLMCCENP